MSSSVKSNTIVQKILGPAVFLVFLILTLYMASSDQAEHIVTWLRNQPLPLLLALVFILPLTGIPLSILWVVVGAVLSPVTAISFALVLFIGHHLLLYSLLQTSASQWLVSKLPDSKLIQRNTNTSWWNDFLFIFTITWLPGISYVFKPVAVLIAGVPFDRYLSMSVASQLVAAIPYLFLGQLVDEGHIGLISLAVFAVTLFAWLMLKIIKKMRVKNQERAA